MMLDLLMPASLVVLFIVFVVQVGYQLFALFAARVLGAFGLPPEIVLLPLLGLLLAHYANVVEDTGPFEHDEIQRPLRDMGLSDDLFFPFASSVAALLLCYFPIPIVLQFISVDAAAIPLGIAWIAGSFLYPAVLLTILTSGSYLDLAPTRLLGMIRACGSQYWISCTTWLIVGPLLAISVLTPRQATVLIPQLRALGEPGLFVPLVAVTIYFAHFFHWHLGLLYRANSVRFPWVLQSIIMDRPRVAVAGQVASPDASSRPARSTREKLRALREAERKRQGEKTMVDQQVERTRPPSSWYF